MDYAIGLSFRMHIFKTPDEMSNLIKSWYTIEKFDAVRTKELAAAIADPANMICFVTSKSFEAESLPLKERWYNIPFSKEKLSKMILYKL